MKYMEITYHEDGPIGTITLNRPADGNMFTLNMCHEIRDCINEIRRETRTRVIILTGAGDRVFCLGGRKEGMEEIIEEGRNGFLFPIGDMRSVKRKLLYLLIILKITGTRLYVRLVSVICVIILGCTENTLGKLY